MFCVRMFSMLVCFVCFVCVCVLFVLFVLCVLLTPSFSSIYISLYIFLSIYPENTRAGWGPRCIYLRAVCGVCVVVCVGVAAFVCDGACVARRVGAVCVSRWVSGFCMCVEAGAGCVVRALFFPLTCIYLYILYLYILKGGSVCMGAGVLCLYPERWGK